MVLWLAWLACTTPPPEPEPCAQTWYADRDDDGYGDNTTLWTLCTRPGLRWSPEGGDCDDLRADVHPTAEDPCDGVDQDCDAEIDEDRPTWYADADGDGYGDATTASSACDPPAGAVADGTDCDDARHDVNPGAWEICDGADQDCDGLADDGQSSWFPDADGDGYGARVDGSCVPFDGAVANDDDCDDTRADLSPAAVETCDGVDENCDNRVDGGSQDADGDGYGHASAAASVCDGGVDNRDDCDDTDPNVHPGAEELCDDVDTDCDGYPDSFEYLDTWDDYDGDGYGNPHAYLGGIACGAWLGVNNDLDCDDLRYATHPGATETCDGRDEDCDGEVDEGLAGTWHADADGDGFGDPSTATAACEAPEGAVVDGTDCDDAAPAVFPGAPELCDGVPDDCAAAATWTEADEDGTASREHADGSWEALSLAPGFHDLPTAGSTTWLCAGVHEGTFEVLGDDVTIAGRYGSDATTLAWTTVAGDPAIAAWRASNLAVRGLGILEGAATGAGASTVPGLDARYADGLLVEDCAFTGLRADLAAAGAEIWYGAATFRGVAFADGETAADGAALRVVDAIVEVSDATFDANVAAGSGGALALEGAAAVACTRCTFDGNAAASGGAVALLGSASTFTATACDFGAAAANAPDDVAIGASYGWTAAATRTFECDAAAAECR